MSFKPIYLKNPVSDSPQAIELTAENLLDVIGAITVNVKGLDGLTVQCHTFKGPKNKHASTIKGTCGHVLGTANVAVDCIEFGTEEDDFSISKGEFFVVLGNGSWSVKTKAEFTKDYGFVEEKDCNGDSK